MQFLSLSSSPFAAWLECLSGDFGRKKRGRRRRKEGREVFVHPSPPLYPRPDPQSLRRTRQDNSSYPISNRKSSAVRGKKNSDRNRLPSPRGSHQKHRSNLFLPSPYCMISSKKIPCHHCVEKHEPIIPFCCKFPSHGAVEKL